MNWSYFIIFLIELDDYLMTYEVLLFHIKTKLLCKFFILAI